MSSSKRKESEERVPGKRYVKMAFAPDRIPENEVRTLAYQIFEANGRQENRADHDWLQAERELLARNKPV